MNKSWEFVKYGQGPYFSCRPFLGLITTKQDQENKGQKGISMFAFWGLISKISKGIGEGKPMIH